MDIPGDLRIAATHEWARINDDGTVTVGITEFAQGELGDIVYVETPEIDMACKAEEGVAVVESVKAASDLYAPVTGTIIDANGELSESPELINDSPYEDGWIFIIKPDDIDELQQLMDPDDYQAMIENNS
jgi:glycine cleavage system H protein